MAVRRRSGNFTLNSFYCLQCGEKSMELPRRRGYKYKKFHRKKLWCPKCGTTINHVECRNEGEILEFKENFANGDYVEEAKESIEHIFLI